MSAAAGAQERPMIQVEPATLTARRVLEIQTGFDYRNRCFLPVAETRTNELIAFDSGISYGIAETVEVSLFWPMVICDTSRGYVDTGDVTLSAKFPLHRLLNTSAMAFRTGVKLPETDEKHGLGNDQLEFRADILASWIRTSYQLHLNAGMLIEDDPTAFAHQNDYMRYGFAFIYNCRKITPLIELSGRVGPDSPAAGNQHTLLIGLRLAHGVRRYDCGLSDTLARNTHSIGVTVGISWQKLI